MNILLPVDGSDYTKKMLAYLVTYPEFFAPSNQFTVLSVQAPLPARARAAVGSEAVQAYYDDESGQITAPVIEFLQRHQIKPTVSHQVGPIGETIANTAQAGKFDLLIMGSHGHSTLGNLLMGSVATQVLAHCSVPVLLIR